MSINVYFCHDFVFVLIKTLHKINILFIMNSGVLSSFLFMLVGFCLMGFGLSGVMSIYRPICLTLLLDHIIPYNLASLLRQTCFFEYIHFCCIHLHFMIHFICSFTMFSH